MNLQTLIAPVGRSTVATIAPLDAEGMTGMTKPAHRPALQSV
jgi:hypothetical protein